VLKRVIFFTSHLFASFICTGVFYKWSDCYSSIAGFDGARYEGFESVDMAYKAFEPISPRTLRARGSLDVKNILMIN